MRQRIRTAEDLSWLLHHTHRFQGGRVSDLHLQKRRLFDEGSGQEVIAGTVVTAIIQYGLHCAGPAGRYGVSRMAKLTMFGATDFSIFEQDGADCSEIGVIHAEVAEGRLRFWFDPRGELYVICDEAELEEISMPSVDLPSPTGIKDWTFQAETGEVPGVGWFLEHLDEAGVPCAWRAVKRTAPAHPAWRWEGHLTPASDQETAQEGLVHIQTYGPLDGYGFGVTLRACDPKEAKAGRLLLILADIIARHFQGTCMAGRHILERDEWRSVPWQVHAQGWEHSRGRGEGLGQAR